MGWAVLSLLLFLPTGIVAVFYASSANTKGAAGQYQSALIDAQNARSWAWISLAIGILVIVVVVAVSSNNNDNSGTGALLLSVFG